MSILPNHELHLEDDEINALGAGAPIGTVHTASVESVEKVLKASLFDEDGRSQFMWIRLANGDLILGVYPQGDTYFEVEEDAQYREDS